MEPLLYVGPDYFVVVCDVEPVNSRVVELEPGVLLASKSVGFVLDFLDRLVK